MMFFNESIDQTNLVHDQILPMIEIDYDQMDHDKFGHTFVDALFIMKNGHDEFCS